MIRRLRVQELLLVATFTGGRVEGKIVLWQAAVAALAVDENVPAEQWKSRLRMDPLRVELNPARWCMAAGTIVSLLCLVYVLVTGGAVLLRLAKIFDIVALGTVHALV